MLKQEIISPKQKEELSRDPQNSRKCFAEH